MTERIRVDRGVDENGVVTSGVVDYDRRADGWYVRTHADDEFWKFATPEANERTVRQLIRKKWDDSFGEPDAWDDRG